MLDLIENTISQNSEILKMSVDDIEFNKSDYVVIDRAKQIIKINKSVFINLKAVKELKFYGKSPSILEVL